MTAIEDTLTLLLVEREGRPGTKGVVVELVRPTGLPDDAPAGVPGAPGGATAGPLAGMPTAMRFQLALLASVLAGDYNAARPRRQGEMRDPAGALVEAAAAALKLSRWLDLALVQLARSMAERAGAQLLTREGEVDPGALSRTRRERWRQQTKSVVANELQALTGRGIQDCHDLVGFALAPSVATQAAVRAMEGGLTDWARVSRWWKRCRRMEVEEAAQVAEVLFAPGDGDARGLGMPDVDGPDVDAPDADDPDVHELDPVGDEDAGPSAVADVVCPSMADFRRVLDREATRIEGRDAVAARRRRQEAVETRTTYAIFEEDGTGCLSITGRTSTVAAAMDRIDSIARKARGAGDGRNLDQLRSDAALALLTHGQVSRPVATGKVVSEGARAAKEGTAGDSDARASFIRQHAALDDGDEYLDPSTGGGWDPEQTERLSSVLDGHAPAVLEVIVPLDVITGADLDGVAEVVGHGFVTGEHARELVTVPGTTLHRLVTDPVKGVALERSVDRYTPDEQMRTVVAAVDRMCRGPGCTKPARSCDLDHVQEYPHGATRITNLAPVDRRHHGMKTNRWWSALMDADRTLTWTTLLGRVYMTGPHDYRQYVGTVRQALRRAEARGAGAGAGTGARAGAGAGPGGGAGEGSQAGAAGVPVLDADLRDRLVYAALAHRDKGGYLSDFDDDAPPEDKPAARSPIFRDRTAPISLRHRTPGGAVRRGAPPRQPDPEQVIGEATEAVIAPPPQPPADPDAEPPSF